MYKTLVYDSLKKEQGISDKLIKLATRVLHFRFISFVLVLFNLGAVRRFLETYFRPYYIMSIIVGGLDAGPEHPSHLGSNVLQLKENSAAWRNVFST